MVNQKNNSESVEFLLTVPPNFEGFQPISINLMKDFIPISLFLGQSIIKKTFCLYLCQWK